METFKVNNLTVTLEQDDPGLFHPRQEEKNVGTMVCWHRNYCLGDMQPKCSPDEFMFQLMSDRELEKCNRDVPDNISTEHVRAYINRHFYVLPLYLYDHSGLTISASPFNCPWDSGQVGFIYAERDCTEYADMRAGLLNEVETYDQYLRADIWYYSVKDDSGNVLDSCGGIFGFDCCKEEATKCAKLISDQLSTSFSI